VRIRGLSDVNVEIEEIKASLAQQAESGHWTDLLHRQVRPALVVGLGLAIFQQITGINTVIYYAPRILQSAGFNSASGAILATVGVGVVNVAMTIVAMFLVDRAGRRPLLLVGIAGMIITLGVLGLSFRYPSGQLGWIAVICLMSYVASFAIGLGPIFWLLIAEIYPLKIRGLAEGTAATFNWASNLIVSLTFLTLVEKLGASSTFLLYALASVASWLFAYYFVPETKGHTLEQIEAFWRARHGVRDAGQQNFVDELPL
jgi:sugar porter (SP) family MFS transporter